MLLTAWIVEKMVSVRSTYVSAVCRLAFISAAQIPNTKSCMYEAEFDFTAMGAGQLSLKQGEKVTLPFCTFTIFLAC